MQSIFVSSTFKDMQSERDVIRNSVLPRLQEKIWRRGYDVSFTDLRWGINSESMDSIVVMGKILSVCTSQIDASRPFMVVLLGDRYGTIPDDAMIEKFLESHRGITYEEARNKSITELEIIYALKNKQQPVFLTVCIRDPLVLQNIPEEYKEFYCGKSDDKQRIDALKNFFTENYATDVIKYSATWDNRLCRISGLDDFADVLTERLLIQLGLKFPDEEMPVEQEQYNYDQTLLFNQSKLFVGRKCYLDEIQQFLASKDSVLLLHGVSGIGKSCLISRVAYELAQENSSAVISLFLGNGRYAVSVENILRSIVFRTARLLNIHSPLEDKMSIAQLKTITKKHIDELSKKKRVVVFFDNLDALSGEELHELIRQLPTPNVECNYKLIMSATTDTVFPINQLIETDYSTIELIGLDEEDLIKIIEKHLQENGKELSMETIRRLQEVGLSRTPVYISLVLKRLLMLSQSDFERIDILARVNGIDGNGAITQYMIDLISALPQTEKDLTVCIIDKICESIDYPSANNILSLVLATNEQLRVEDVLSILHTCGENNLKYLDIITFITAATGLISVDSDGQIRFCHKLIRDAMKKELCMQYPSYYSAIFKHLEHLNDADYTKHKLLLTIAYRTNEVQKAADYFAKIHFDTDKEGDNDNAKTAERIYRSFQELFYYESKERNDIIRFLNCVSDYAATQGADYFNAVCQEYLFGIFFAINKVTLGIGDSELRLLNPLYDKAIETLIPNATQNSEYVRTSYMIAEKCGVYADDTEEKWKYFQSFNHQCIEFAKTQDESSPHYDYTLSDLAFSYEKIAQYQFDVFQRWRESAHVFDMAIKAVSRQVKPSTNKIDLLDNLKFEFIRKKHTVLLKKAVFNKQIGFESENLLELLTNAETDLLACSAFFAEATNSFVQSERSMELCHYWYELMNVYIALSELYIVESELIKQEDCLKRALIAAKENYKLVDNAYNLDMIRNIYFRLGTCDSTNVDDKIHYLKKSFVISDEVTRLLPDGDASKLVDFKNEVAGQLMKLRFESIHTGINTEDASFINEPRKVFFANATQIEEANFRDILLRCEEYLLETNPPIIPKVSSYRRGNDSVVDIMFAGLHMTSANALCFGVNSMYARFKVGYEYIEKSQSIAVKSFRDIVETGRSMCSVAKLLTERSIDEQIIVCAILALDPITKSAHNMLVMADRDNKEVAIWEKAKREFSQDYLFFGLLYEIFYPNNQTIIKQIDYYREREIYYYLCESTAAACVFALCIRHGKDKLSHYLSFIKGKEYNCWYNHYQELFNLKDITINTCFDTIGKYLCESIDELASRRILYHSNYYECIALEWAFKAKNSEVVDKIIYNGYDNYLELGTLYIIRKYDRTRYYEEIKKLKVVCLSRNAKIMKENYYIGHRYIRNIYGDVFCDEFIRLSKIAKKAIDRTDMSDVRNHAKRNIPDWAK